MRRKRRHFVQLLFSNSKHFTKVSSGPNRPPRCWRFWWVSIVSILMSWNVKTGLCLDGMQSIAVLSVNITQISSPLSMHVLTGVSSDQCKPWASDASNIATLAWSYETRLLLVSISNIYELWDTSTLDNHYNEMQYNPKTLTAQNVNIENTEGLGFHLSLNATPICGASRLPTKILCNDGIVIPFNKTVPITPTDAFTQSICGGKFFISYTYTYSCSNSHFFPPSCKTPCQSTINTTHCYNCDHHDGHRRCCPGTQGSECAVVAMPPSILSQTASQENQSISGAALILTVALGGLSSLLLLVCLVLTVLLACERRRSRRTKVAQTRSNGWMKNGAVPIQQDSHKNGTYPNGHSGTEIMKNGVHPVSWLSPHVPEMPNDRRPASCEPSAIIRSCHQRRTLDVQKLYANSNGNGNVRYTAPRMRAPLEGKLGGPQAGSSRAPKMGTLF